jgi:hypothetical protein
MMSEPVSVFAVALERLGHRQRDARQRGLVEHPVATGDELADQRFVRDVALHEVEVVTGAAPREVVERAEGEIVQDDDLRAPAAERPGGRAPRPCATR